MTEFELITLVVERRVEMIALMQWWASVSFAIVAGSHIFEKNLTLRLLILIDGFYLFFTLASFRLIYSLGEQFQAAFADLEQIKQPTEQTLKMISQNSGGSVELNQGLVSLICLAVVLVTCAYPIWLLREDRNAI